jgi:hypothetical protein
VPDQSLKAEDEIMCCLFSNSGGTVRWVWISGGILISRAKLKKLGCLTREKNFACVHVRACHWNICEVTNCIYFCQHFCINTLYINYLLYVPAFWPTLGMHIHHWLHCSLLYIGQCECKYLMMAKRPKHVLDN